MSQLTSIYTPGLLPTLHTPHAQDIPSKHIQVQHDNFASFTW